MTIKEFIERAIEGGWKKSLVDLPLCEISIDRLTRKQGDTVGVWFYYSTKDERGVRGSSSIEILASEILLDPKSWQAVGKVSRWKSEAGDYYNGIAYQEHMHRFIDALCDDKPLETALNESTL